MTKQKKAEAVLNDFFGDDEFNHDMSAKEAWDCIKELLSERETIEPIKKNDNNGWTQCFCGGCGSYLLQFNTKLHLNISFPKYCSECGRKVKWE